MPKHDPSIAKGFVRCSNLDNLGRASYIIALATMLITLHKILEDCYCTKMAEYTVERAMTVKHVLEWLNETISLEDGSPGNKQFILAFQRAILATLDANVGVATFNGQADSVDAVATLHFYQFARYLADTGYMHLAERFLTESGLIKRFIAILPPERRELLLRCVVSMEILKRLSESYVSDIRLTDQLRRIYGLRECKPLSLGCLLRELTAASKTVEDIVHGLTRLWDAVFSESSVNFFEYSTIVLSLIRMDADIAKAVAGSLGEYFDSNTLFASELAYHAYWMAVFRHGILPEEQREILERAYYSPDPVVACRARQLLEKEPDAGRIDEWGIKPCLVLASYKGNENLYVLE